MSASLGGGFERPAGSGAVPQGPSRGGCLEEGVVRGPSLGATGKAARGPVSGAAPAPAPFEDTGPAPSRGSSPQVSSESVGGSRAVCSVTDTPLLTLTAG